MFERLRSAMTTRLSLAPLAVLVLGITACSTVSVAPRHFVLQQGALSQSQPSDMVINVSLPLYLRDSGLVLAQGAHEIHHAKSFHWAEPLATGVERSLRYDLSRAAEGAGFKGVNKLDVVVQQFHGSQSGRVILTATWQAKLGCTQQGGPLEGYFAQELAQEGSGYSAMVQAQRLLLTKLSDEIKRKVAAQQLKACGQE